MTAIVIPLQSMPAADLAVWRVTLVTHDGVRTSAFVRAASNRDAILEAIAPDHDLGDYRLAGAVRMPTATQAQAPLIEPARADHGAEWVATMPHPIESDILPGAPRLRALQGVHHMPARSAIPRRVVRLVGLLAMAVIAAAAMAGCGGGEPEDDAHHQESPKPVNCVPGLCQ